MGTFLGSLCLIGICVLVPDKIKMSAGSTSPCCWYVWSVFQFFHGFQVCTLFWRGSNGLPMFAHVGPWLIVPSAVGATKP